MSNHENRPKGEIERYTSIQAGRIAGRTEQLIADLARRTQVSEDDITAAVARILCSEAGWEIIRTADHLPEMRHQAIAGNRTVESVAVVEHPHRSLPETTSPDRRVAAATRPGRPGRVRCDICDSRDPKAKGFRSLKAMRKHKETEHRDEGASKQPPLPFAGEKFACPACPEKFASNYLLVRHTELMHGGKKPTELRGGSLARRCKLCGKSVPNQSALMAHYKTAHGSKFGGAAQKK